MSRNRTHKAELAAEHVEQRGTTGSYEVSTTRLSLQLLLLLPSPPLCLPPAANTQRT
jgi:hypothetical protein